MPLGAALALAALYWVVRSTPIDVGRFGDVRSLLFGGPELKLLKFLVAIPLVILAVNLIDALLFEVFLQRRTGERAPTLLRQLISLALYLLLLIGVIHLILEYRVTGLLLGGTVVAAVLGLALQDTLGNLFAGMSIHVERTFKVGDLIRSGDQTGVVEWASWRATKLRTFNNNVVVVPNALLAREKLEVFPRENLNARLVRVTAGYEYPPKKVIGTLERAVRNLEWIASDLPALARVAEFGESGLVYEVKYWTRSYHLRDTIDAEIRKAIWYAFKRAGIAIALPIRSVAPLRQAPPERASQEQIARRIAATEVLGPLSAEERERLVGTIHSVTFARGETILTAGEVGDSMYVIEEGSVSVRRPDTAGGAEIARLGAGEMFGEMGLLTGEGRGATVVAVSDVVVLEIDKEALQPILQENPALVDSISKIMAERQARTAASSKLSLDDTHPRLLARIASWFGV